MHTNATVTIDSSGTSATLTIGDDKVVMQFTLPSGAVVGTTTATRYPTDPTPPEPDQENPGVTVVTIDMPAGSNTVEVLFNPTCSGQSSSFSTPPSVALADWTLTSHN